MKTLFSSRVLVQGGLVFALMTGFVGCLTDDKGDENSGPTISIGPITQIVSDGATASFTVIASGTGDLDYQWTLNGTDLEGKTAATLNIVARDSIDNATIRVRVTDDNGSTTSDPAYLRIAVESRSVTLGAQGNTIASSWDADVPVTYNASTAPNHSNDIDVVFAYSTSTGNDSLALYSPAVAKNGLGSGSAGFDFMSTWPTANSIEIRRVDVADWENVMTAADIENLFTNGSAGATPGRIFVRVGTTVVIKTNLNLYVLMRVTAVSIQSETGTGTINAKAKW